MCTYVAAAENGKGLLRKKLLLIGTLCLLSYVIPNALSVSIYMPGVDSPPRISGVQFGE